MTRLLASSLALVVVSLLAFASWSEVAAAGATGSIAGLTVDGSGAPVAGATVLLAGQGMTTQVIGDSAGRFRFNRIPVGSYGLTASVIRGNEVGTGSATVTVQNKQTTNVTIVMTFSSP